MESDIVFRVYYNGEIIPHTEGVSFVSESSISYVAPDFTSFSALRNIICQSIDSHISKVIHWNMRAQIPLIELYVEFEDVPTLLGGYDSDVGEHREITWYEDNSDSEDDPEVSCGFNKENENVGEEEEANAVRQIAMEVITRQQQSISRASSSDLGG
ncbi:hypothetical protein PIB30_010284 [Stylosanthes scabra]|uniref:Uncharacterized protein n=1 Tax=Stylosanthes scabra TaxID=79078 RepID=A0ABU6T5D7_9FABA|nr:hypothetical protein [Stylosanthes scabra]